MIGLTPRMRELLVYLQEREHPPTYQQMANALGLKAKSRTWEMVQALQERGHVTVRHGTIYLTERPVRLRVVFGPEELAARAAMKRRLWAHQEAA